MADSVQSPFLLYTATFCILVALAMSETATSLFRKLVPGLAQSKATADAPVPPSEQVTAELQGGHHRHGQPSSWRKWSEA